MKYYLLGAGGVSMSALAIMLKYQGDFVCGSDETEGSGTKILREFGIDVDFSLEEKHIQDADVVVFSSAIHEDDPHMVLAKELGKKIISRGELLAEICKSYEKVIAVAGSHGKTTTTAMIFEVLSVAGLNPSLHLGGYRVQDGKNFHLGGREYFVTEACEYHNNFLFLHPYISVVTNVEKEHMDFFKSFSNQLRAFETFKKQSTFVIEKTQDIVATNIRHDRKGGLMFCLEGKSGKIMDLHLHICEDVNTENCIYAYRVAKMLGFDDCVIKLGLERFLGVKTRFERMNCNMFSDCVFDYAHHPTEIEKAIDTASKIFKRKHLVTIFQPHTYSRTKTLLPEFVKVFKDLPCPIFFKTYAAREKPEDGISGEELCKIIKKHNKNARYFENFSDLKQFLSGFKSSEVALLFVGAGDLPSILHKNHFVE